MSAIPAHLVEVAIQRSVIQTTERRPLFLSVLRIVVDDPSVEDNTDDVTRRDAFAPLVLGVGTHLAAVVQKQFLQKQFALFEEHAAVLLKVPHFLRHFDKDVAPRRLGPEDKLGLVGDVRRVDPRVLGVRRRAAARARLFRQRRRRGRDRSVHVSDAEASSGPGQGDSLARVKDLVGERKRQGKAVGAGQVHVVEVELDVGSADPSRRWGRDLDRQGERSGVASTGGIGQAQQRTRESSTSVRVLTQL